VKNLLSRIVFTIVFYKPFKIAHMCVNVGLTKEINRQN
jgi:hypothetical protein